jgi:ATP-dependent RNA helicase DDX19/DBP5
LNAKTRVLKEMIFPNCEKLGQTIIFVRTRDGARALHKAMEQEGYKCTSLSVSRVYPGVVASSVAEYW